MKKSRKWRNRFKLEREWKLEERTYVSFHVRKNILYQLYMYIYIYECTGIGRNSVTIVPREGSVSSLWFNLSLAVAEGWDIIYQEFFTFDPFPTKIGAFMAASLLLMGNYPVFYVMGNLHDHISYSRHAFWAYNNTS